MDSPLLPEKNSEWKKILPPFLLCLVIWALFSPALSYDFLEDWDDHIFILDNTLLEPTLANFMTLGTTTFQDLYTPLPMWSFMLDKLLFGFVPEAYRAVNIFWHTAAALFLYGIFRQLGLKRVLAFAGALLWAVSPQKVESVVWITERKDVLCGAFAFLSFWAFQRSVKAERLPVAATFFGILSLLAKPAAAPLPGVMIVYTVCLWRNRRSFSDYFRILLLPVLSFLLILLWSGYVTSNGFPGEPEKRMLVLIHNLIWYPVTSSIPFELNPMYPNIREWSFHFPLLLAGSAGIFCVILAAWKTGIRGYFLAGWLLVIAGLMVPVLGLVSYTAMDYCDRYNYLVSAAVWGFLCTILSRYLRKMPEKKRPVFSLLILLAAVFSVRGLFYMPVWKHCDPLFLYAVRNGRPANQTALENGIQSAIKSKNYGMLKEMAEIMMDDFARYRPEDIHLTHTALFLTAHVSAAEGKNKEALDAYQRLAGLIRAGELDLMDPDTLLPVLMRGGAEFCMLQERPAAAGLFFREYFKVKKDRSAEYYWMAAQYAALRKDLPARRNALENLVRLMPENQSFRKMLDDLPRKTVK